MRAQNDHCRLMIVHAQARYHIEAVEFRHLDIKDQRIGMMLKAKMDCLEAIGCLAHNRETSEFQQPAQAASYDAVIVS